MSSRALQKAQLRAEREAAERREIEQAHRRRVLRLWAVAGILAVAVAALAALSLSGGSDGGSAADGDAVAGATESAEMLRGIPQDGTMLGDPKAKVVLTEFADLQCPYCRDYALGVLPQIIERYVRTGKVRLDLRLLRFIGPDSVRGAQVALAAAGSDRMWQFVDLWYRNQGTENTGYAKDGFIEDLAKAAGVMNPLEAIETSAHEKQLQSAELQAQAAGIESTPSFLLDGKRFEPEQLTIEAFQPALDAAVGR